MLDGRGVPLATGVHVEVIARVVVHFAATFHGRLGCRVRRSASVEVGDLHEQRAGQLLGVADRSVGAEFKRDRGADLVAPGRAGNRGVPLEQTVQGQRGHRARLSDQRDHHRCLAPCGRHPPGEPAGTGACHRRRLVRGHRVPRRGQPVHQRGECNDGGDVAAPGRRSQHRASGERDAPQDQTMWIDAREHGGSGHRGAVVLELTCQRHHLPW